MKLLENDTTLTTPEQGAALLMDVVPQIMRVIRAEIRGVADISVPQFRAMAFLDRHSGTPLSSLAEHIGLTMPTMSKMIDGLVERKLVTRESSSSDRRRIKLSLTPDGSAVLESVRSHIQARLAEHVGRLQEAELAVVVQAMQVLQLVFLPGSEDEMEKQR